MNKVMLALGWLALAVSGNALALETLPIQGSDVATSWDGLYNFLVYLSIFFFILVMGAVVYFAVKYKAKPGVKVRYITDHHLLEGVWTFVPFVLLMVIFVWGYVVYEKMVRTPSDAYEIRVVGKQWLWQFQYDDGRTTINEVFVPTHRPVKFVMTSTDVLHSMFIPNFRVKQDVVPGMYSSVWFEANLPGKHQIFCTEYCGAAHSQMLAQVIALDEAEWKEWSRGKKILTESIPKAGTRLSDASGSLRTTDQTQMSAAAPTLSLVEQGRAHFKGKGCVACHSVDGQAKGNLGPTLKGVFGNSVALTAGGSAIRDENYIRESIENPMAKVVKGFNPVMPTFKGQLSENDLGALIAYIKSLQ
jgi:cytochrome c oxidase subunit 2